MSEIIRDEKGRIKKGVGQNTNKNGTAGRPTVVTPEVIAKLETAYAMDCTDAEACLFADIKQSTLYRYQERNPEFVERKKALKNKPFLIARTEILKGMRGNPELALKYMERKKKDEFSTKQDVEHSGDLKLVIGKDDAEL